MYFISTSILDNSQMIVRLVGEVTMWIPMNAENVDYQDYLSWLAEGNEPEPWNPEGGE